MRVIGRGLWKPCHSCHGARKMIGGCGGAQPLLFAHESSEVVMFKLYQSTSCTVNRAKLIDIDVPQYVFEASFREN